MCQTVLIFPKIYIVTKKWKHFGPEILGHFELKQVLNCFKYFLNIFWDKMSQKSNNKNYIKCQNVLKFSNCIH